MPSTSILDREGSMRVPTCSVMSRIHFDKELACRHSEVRPVVRGRGRRITFTSRSQWQRAVSLFCRPSSWHIHTRQKKRKKRNARLKQREKVCSKGKSCTKTNSCNQWPWPINRVRKSWDGQFRVMEAHETSQSLSSWGERSSTMVQPFGESDMHQLLKQRVPNWFIMATSGNKSFESTKIDCGRTPTATVDGCLAGRRPYTLRTSKTKLIQSLSQTKWRSWENLSNRFSSFLGVHQMILATFKSVNNASCRGMWEQLSKPSDLGLDCLYIAHPAVQVPGAVPVPGAPRDHGVGAENARSRVLAGPRDSGRHFVSKCPHCACSVSHERGPNARSYVKSSSPPPPLCFWSKTKPGSDRVKTGRTKPFIWQNSQLLGNDDKQSRILLHKWVDLGWETNVARQVAFAMEREIGILNLAHGLNEDTVVIWREF